MAIVKSNLKKKTGTTSNQGRKKPGGYAPTAVQRRQATQRYLANLDLREQLLDLEEERRSRTSGQNQQD